MTVKELMELLAQVTDKDLRVGYWEYNPATKNYDFTQIDELKIISKMKILCLE